MRSRLEHHKRKRAKLIVAKSLLVLGSILILTGIKSELQIDVQSVATGVGFLMIAITWIKFRSGRNI